MSLREFEGNINGKIYRDELEFKKALLLLEEVEEDGETYVSYRYLTSKSKSDDKPLELECDGGDGNYVSESKYVKNINSEKDVELDDDLVNKLKNASNKSHIKETVYRKIDFFENNISDNLSYINSLKSDRKKLEDNIDVINNQIKTLDDANNNYYLHKKYYAKIKNLVEGDYELHPVEVKCDCESNDKCKCNLDDDNIIYQIQKEMEEYLDKMNIHNLSELVEYFLKK